ncbi:MAG: PEP/pyruvate-binding domain-containing protein [Fidelibacterota bacterium]
MPHRIQHTGLREIDFQDLMVFRIYEIMLVSSPYDAFVLEEGGRLTEQILEEYHGMNFNYPPRVWHVNSGKEALQLLSSRKLDLILIMTRITDMNPLQLAERIKVRYPKKPVILLAFDQSEVHELLDVNLLPTLPVDHIFLWTGHAEVLLAIIKFIEDKRNASRDIKKGDVRAIIFIEDTPKYYSTILPILYKVIMYHQTKLLNKHASIADRLLHLRARPKILFATTYEEAKSYFTKFHRNLFGVISDIRFPKDGVMNPRAGIELTHYIREKEPTIPVMLQSSDLRRQDEAHREQAAFLNKLSTTLLQDIRDFVSENFGFGDFVFRLPSGEEVGRVRDLEELEAILSSIPIESIRYHANSNHFSNWLAARGEFELASKIRSRSETDYDFPEERRQYYITIIHDRLHPDQERTRRKISTIQGDLPPLIRIGNGSMGGKARGLVFINRIIREPSFRKEFPGVNIRIPLSIIIDTDEFDHFMDENKLWDVALASKSNDEILASFTQAKLSNKLLIELKAFTKKVTFPIAVRSSGILEDSQYRPLAGFYSTFMLPNNHPEQAVRFSQLCEAIKRIYASMYYQVPKSYSQKSQHRHDEEKMAIIIMELIGHPYGDKFYPTLSGTAQSINYYPVSYMERSDGIATIALGFGKTVVEGERSLRFSPKYTHILPQYYSVKATLASSQTHFYALSLDPGKDPLEQGEEGNLQRYHIDVAEKDGTLYWAGSVIDYEDNIVRDSLRYSGPRVITFAPILKYNQFPLADIITRLLKMGEHALGSPVEIEFAVNLFRKKELTPEFCLLQIKPMAMNTLEYHEDATTLEKQNIFARSSVALGNGRIDGLQYILYVNPDTFDTGRTKDITVEIETLNNAMQEDYILIGPGRWGTADPWLGVPVRWNQISNAKIIVEIGIEDFPIDPSFGSHFFQNVTSMRLGYFTINHKSTVDGLDSDWIQSLEIVEQLKYTTLYKTPRPMLVTIDGNTGEGLILKQIIDERLIMDEQESSGI